MAAPDRFASKSDDFAAQAVLTSRAGGTAGVHLLPLPSPNQKLKLSQPLHFEDPELVAENLNALLKRPYHRVNYYDKSILIKYPLAIHLVKQAFQDVFAKKLPRTEILNMAAFLGSYLDTIHYPSSVRILLVGNQSFYLMENLRNYICQMLSFAPERVDYLPGYAWNSSLLRDIDYYTIFLTEAAVHDSKAMSLVPVEPGNYYLMDKGYVDFKQLFLHFHRQRAFFVTRAKDNMKYEVVEEHPVDKSTGVVSDSTIRLTGLKTSRWYPDTLRMVVYEDYATGNVYRFLTNDFTHSYLTIAELYRERWQVECFFKWIKQHLNIKAFYGTSQNAVYSQIWIAICDYLLLAIARKMFHIDQELYILSSVVGKVLFERKPLGELFIKPKRPMNDSDSDQLNLWGNFFGQ